MGMEQVLYAQVVVLSQKYLKITEENRIQNEDKLKFQGHSAISHR